MHERNVKKDKSEEGFVKYLVDDMVLCLTEVLENYFVPNIH